MQGAGSDEVAHRLTVSRQYPESRASRSRYLPTFLGWQVGDLLQAPLHPGIDGLAVTLGGLGAHTRTSQLYMQANGANNTTLYDYDAAGRLRQTLSGPTTTEYLYDADRLVAEYDGAGALLRRYVHGAGLDEPILWYEAGLF